MPDFFQFEISRTLAGLRLDRALQQALSLDAGAAAELIEAGAVFLNGRRKLRAAHRVRAGDRIRAPKQLPPAPRVDLRDRILHRDRHLLVVDKPAGVAAAPTPQGVRGTLPALLADQLGLPRAPTVVHRLDRDVSGVMALALSKTGARELTAAFEGRRAGKWYRAWVAGAPPEAEGTIEAPLGRDPKRRGRMRVTRGGDAARTDYRVLRSPDDDHGYAVLGVRLHTGRTHQIRVHLAHLGCPLLGDRFYGGPPQVRHAGVGTRVPRLCLHAERLELPGGEGDEARRFEARVPDFLAPAE